MKLTKEQKLELFEKAPVTKAIPALVGPTVLSQLVSIIYNLADAFFVGRLGDPHQIAALSLIFPLYMSIVMLGNLFGIGANSVIARALGVSDFEKVKKTSALSVWASAGAALLLSVVFGCSMKNILLFIGASESSLGHASEYLRYTIVWGAVPSVVQLCLAHLLRAEGAARQSGFGIVLGGMLNIVLDPIFIFLYGSGVAGAGIATLISNTVALIYFLLVLWRMGNRSFLSLSPRDFGIRYAPEVIAVGVPSALMILFGSISNIVMTRTASAYGDTVVASFGILQKYNSIAIHISNGVGQGVMPLLGFNYSRRNRERIKNVSSIALGICASFGFSIIIAVELFPAFFASVFAEDPDTVGIASRFLRFGYPGCLGAACICYFNAFFQAFGKGLHGAVLGIVRQLGLFIPAILILNALWGVDGLALSYTVSEMLSLLLGTAMYAQLLRKTLNPSVAKIYEKV